MPRPIFGTCALTVLQQQRRGRAVATGQHSRTTITRRVRIRDRTQHTWTALHTRSKRSARRQKVRRHPPTDSSPVALLDSCLVPCEAHSSLGESALPTSRPSCCVAWPDHLLGLNPARAPAAFPLSGRSRTTQQPIRRHSCRLSGVSFVHFPLLDHPMSYVTKELSLSCERRPTSKPREH